MIFIISFHFRVGIDVIHDYNRHMAEYDSECGDLYGRGVRLASDDEADLDYVPPSSEDDGGDDDDEVMDILTDDEEDFDDGPLRDEEDEDDDGGEEREEILDPLVDSSEFFMGIGVRNGVGFASYKGNSLKW